MSRKLFLLLVAIFAMAFIVKAEDNVEEANIAETEEVAPGDKKEEKAEINEIDAVEKAKEADADANITDEGQEAVAKEEAEDKAAGKEDAVVEGEVAEKEAEKIAADVNEPAIEKKESGSWFSWLWPFSSGKKAVVADAEGDAVAGDKVEAAEVVAEDDVVEVKEVVAEDAEGDVVEIKEEVAEAAPAEPKVDEKAGEKGEEKSVMRAVLLYIPNILLNLTDIISLGVGAGAEAGLELRLTRYCQFGGQYGDAYFVEKGYDRRFGGGYDNGYSFQLAALANEKRYVDKTFGGVQGFIINQPKARINTPEDPLYKSKKRDFWAIGVEAGWLINLKLNIHPIEIADFLASIIALDISDDNME